MALQIIGAGFGRTGTVSLKFALESLGYRSCYHMMEVFSRPHHVPMWRAAMRGEPAPWDELFTDFVAGVDWPVCSFWRELADHFPAAKVLLSVRDSESWYLSMERTIYPRLTGPAPAQGDPPLRTMAKELIFDRTFGGRFADKAHAIAVFERHNQAVIDALPPERLLVFRASDGWEPLCRFLGTEVPNRPFPHENPSTAFAQNFPKDGAMVDAIAELKARGRS